MIDSDVTDFGLFHAFAVQRIPTVLRDEGGTLSKAALFNRLKKDFSADLGAWPDELNDIDGSHRPRARTAFAFALSRLVMSGQIEATGRSGTVTLQIDPNRGNYDAADPDALPEAQIVAIERNVRLKASGRLRVAIGKGLPYDEDFVARSIAAVRATGYRCALSGLHFDLSYKTDGAGGQHLAPSPDRIDPALGYTADNVIWILWCLNRGKGRMSSEKFLTVLRAAGTAIAGANA